MMSSAMMVAGPRLSMVMGARPAPDNDHVSELIDVSVAAVLIDENHAAVPMMIVP